MKLLQSFFLLDLFLSPFVGRPAVSDFVWATKIGGSGQDYGQGIAMDNARNVYVTGYFSDNALFGGQTLVGNGNADVFLAKYDNAGRPLWFRQAGGGGDDGGYAVAADVNGNCFITGRFDGSIKFGNTTLTTGRWK